MTEQEYDEAYLESIRTEQHPDRDTPEVPDGVEFKRDVVFGSVKGRDLTADTFTPKEPPPAGRPAIVFLHGGSWRLGSPSQFHFHSGYLAKKYGFFAVNVDYRFSSEAKFPAALQDANCAVRWVRSKANQLNIDTDRIALAGGSAGAHLSMLSAATDSIKDYQGYAGNEGFSSSVNLVISFNGEFDLWDLVEKKSLIEPMEWFIGGTPEELPEKYDELSSIKRVHKDMPPVLLLHGTEDKCVSHNQSVALYERLKQLGVYAEIELYEGKPHAWFNTEPDRTITLKRMEQFLVSQFNLTETK